MRDVAWARRRQHLAWIGHDGKGQARVAAEGSLIVSPARERRLDFVAGRVVRAGTESGLVHTRSIDGEATPGHVYAGRV